jgi:hypothetical protein
MSPSEPATGPANTSNVRLIAEDGYQAQRSYSIASPPKQNRLILTVERLSDGEVSLTSWMSCTRAMLSSCAARSVAIRLCRKALARARGQQSHDLSQMPSRRTRSGGDRIALEKLRVPYTGDVQCDRTSGCSSPRLFVCPARLHLKPPGPDGSWFISEPTVLPPAPRS